MSVVQHTRFVRKPGLHSAAISPFKTRKLCGSAFSSILKSKDLGLLWNTFFNSASVSWRKTNEQTNNQWTVKSLKILGKQTLLESNFQIFILQCNNTKHLTINFKVTLLHYLSIRKRQKAFQTSTKQVFHLFTFTTTFSKDNWENIQINNIWKILFPSGREAERRIFGSIYIPETPGVNPKEEKEVEFCSEVLILASTFQASVGEVQGRKNNKLHIASNVEEVSYLMMNRVK